MVIRWTRMAVCLLLGSELTRAQDGPAVQPSIMVMPFARESEDVRTVLEADINRRIAVAKLKEAFDRRGATTIDFVARLKAATENALITADNSAGARDEFIQFSGADIVVQVEVSVQPGSTGTSVTVVLSAFDAATGTSLASGVGRSGRFVTDDVDRLVQRAVDERVEQMLNEMQKKFEAMRADGRPMLLDVSVAAGVKATLESVPRGGAETVAELVEQWVAKRSVKGMYHLQGATARRLIIDDLRVPVRDEAGRPVTPTRFFQDLLASLRTAGVTARRDVKGGTVLVTVSGVSP